MGMFDYVAVESHALDQWNLAPSPRDKPVYQTKSLECLIDTLVLKDFSIIDVETNEVKIVTKLILLEKTYKETGVFRRIGKVQIPERVKTKEVEKEIPFHGILSVYAPIKEFLVNKPNTWLHLKLKFTDGTLVSVEEDKDFNDR